MSQNRYFRQSPLFGDEGQEKLRNARVGVAGCGGLGTTLLTNLASAGVGNLVIADGDVPDITNLNRQFVYREGESGHKADLMKKWLTSVNPDISVVASCEFLNEDNLDRLFRDCDILVDCLDRISTRKILSRYAVRTGKPLVHAGVTGFTGQLTVVVPGRTPDLEQIYGKIADAPAGTITPSVGSMVSTLASLEATQVIQMITSVGIPFIGKMLMIDLNCGTFDIIDLVRCRDSPLHHPSVSDRIVRISYYNGLT